MEHLHTETRGLRGNEVLALDDPRAAWTVDSGSLAVFVVRMRPDGTPGERRFLFEVGAGDGLFGLGRPDSGSVWIVAVANDPVTLDLLRGVWGGESHEQERLRQLKQTLDMLPTLPAEARAELEAKPAPPVRHRSCPASRNCSPTPPSTRSGSGSSSAKSIRTNSSPPSIRC